MSAQKPISANGRKTRVVRYRPPINLPLQPQTMSMVLTRARRAALPSSSAPKRLQLPLEIWELIFVELEAAIRKHNWSLKSRDPRPKLDFAKALADLRLTCRSSEYAARARLFATAESDLSVGCSRDRIQYIASSDRLRYAVKEVHLVYHCPRLNINVDTDKLRRIHEQFEEGSTMRRWQADKTLCREEVPRLLSSLPNVHTFKADLHFTTVWNGPPDPDDFYDLERQAVIPSLPTAVARSINALRPREHDPLFLSLKTIFSRVESCLPRVRKLQLSLEYFSDLEEFGLLPLSRPSETPDQDDHLQRTSQLQQWVLQLSMWAYIPTKDEKPVFLPPIPGAVVLSRNNRNTHTTYIRTPPAASLARLFSNLQNAERIVLEFRWGIRVSTEVLFPVRLRSIDLRCVDFTSVSSVVAAIEGCKHTLRELCMTICKLPGRLTDFYEYLAQDQQRPPLQLCSLEFLSNGAYDNHQRDMETSDRHRDLGYTIEVNGRRKVRDGKVWSGTHLFKNRQLESVVYRLRDKVIRNGDPALFAEMENIEQLEKDEWQDLHRRVERHWTVYGLAK